MKRLLAIILTVLPTVSAHVVAWPGMRMPKLHVEGRFLTDDDGNCINLHGFGQTYSPWFNERGSRWTDYDVDGCLRYNMAQIDGMMRRGWKVNWIRIHMDPYWSNVPGQAVGGEDDISAFDMHRFEKYFDEVFLRMAAYSESRGLYVVMRPPGVCPGNMSRGDAYHKYLVRVWTHVARRMVENGNDTYMFELANEPIHIDGSVTAFFQEIVDSIRATGCNNILWIPGTGYQSDYRDFAANPVRGSNIGYAVHAYPGWYGSDAEVESAESTGDVAGGGYAGFLRGWYERVKCVAGFAPVLLTEMDWAPGKYGCSWGKSVTGTRCGSGFGANLKYMCDLLGNVSWMLFTGPELLACYDDDAEDGSTFLTDPEACVRAVYRWYADYAAEWPAARTRKSRRMVSLEVSCPDTVVACRGDILTIPVDALYADGHRRCVSACAIYRFGDPGVAYAEGAFVHALKEGLTDIDITLPGRSKALRITLVVTGG